MPWRYRLPARFYLFAPELAAVSYGGDWLEIRDCRLSIPAGYAWDGCSPSLRLPARPLLPSGIWLGPWDGPLGIDGRPVTWRATLVHDVLCQFREDIQGLGKSATVRLFARMLENDGAPGWMRRLYPAAVSLLGPQSWPGSDTAAGRL